MGRGSRPRAAHPVGILPKSMQWRSQYRGKGGRVPPLTAKNLPKIGKNQEKRGKSGKIRKNSGKKEEKSGRKGKNREDSFTLPFLTKRAEYATESMHQIAQIRFGNCKVFIASEGEHPPQTPPLFKQG